jgi:hypothetical protein
MNLAEKSMFNTCMTFSSERAEDKDLGERSLVLREMESYLPSEVRIFPPVIPRARSVARIITP